MRAYKTTMDTLSSQSPDRIQSLELFQGGFWALPLHYITIFDHQYTLSRITDLFWRLFQPLEGAGGGKLTIILGSCRQRFRATLRSPYTWLGVMCC